MDLDDYTIFVNFNLFGIFIMEKPQIIIQPKSFLFIQFFVIFVNKA